jgi:hypothetical protein
MNSKFDELAKGLAQSITRLEAFKRFGVCLAVITSACSLAFPARAQFAQLGPLVELSQPNPAGTCDNGFRLAGTMTPNDSAEPFVAVNPAHPNNIVAEWTLGPLLNNIAGVSFNGGQSWQQVPVPLSVCSGGSFVAAGDPSLAFAPNGDLYAAGVSGNAFATDDIYVCKSTDGGLHWSLPVAMPGNNNPPNDVPVILVDPTDAHFVYVAWDGPISGHRGQAMFTRSADAGVSWELNRSIVQTAPQDYVQRNQLLVLPNGALVDVYELVNVKDSGHGIQQSFSLQVIRSTDHGQTWSVPANAAVMLPLYGGPLGNSLTVDPENGQLVADPINQSVAADRQGNLYAVWEDGRFSNFQYNDIAFSMSADGGFTWSAPIRVNQTPLNIPPGNRQAFLPTIAVARNGTIGVTYYDFRFNDANPGVPTDYWLVQCSPSSTTAPANLANWGNELRLTPASFNLEACPIKVTGYFLGDYLGLAAAGNGFISTFTQPDPNNSFGSIFARRVGP